MSNDVMTSIQEPPEFVKDDPSNLHKLHSLNILDKFYQSAEEIEVTDDCDPVSSDVNTKMGKGIYSFSMSPVITCPHASSRCLSTCYVVRLLKTRKCVRDAYMRNYELSKQSGFEDMIVGSIIKNNINTMRVHVSGDFYSAEYAEKWLNISRRSPNTKFYCYTRSWKDPEIRRVLSSMSRRKDWSVWYSTDAEMGVINNKPKNVRVAYLMMDDEDVPEFGGIDNVFRVKRNTVLEDVNGAPVCTNETGIKHEPKITCAKCKRCIDRA